MTVAIITDSAAGAAGGTRGAMGITVVPMWLTIDDRSELEGTATPCRAPCRARRAHVGARTRRVRGRGQGRAPHRGCRRRAHARRRDECQQRSRARGHGVVRRQRRAVIDTGSAAGGQALVVLAAAAAAAQPDATLADVVARATWVAGRVRLVATLSEPRPPRAERASTGHRGLGRQTARHPPAVRVPWRRCAAAPAGAEQRVRRGAHRCPRAAQRAARRSPPRGCAACARAVERDGAARSGRPRWSSPWSRSWASSGRSWWSTPVPASRGWPGGGTTPSVPTDRRRTCQAPSTHSTASTTCGPATSTGVECMREPRNDRHAGGPTRDRCESGRGVDADERVDGAVHHRDRGPHRPGEHDRRVAPVARSGDPHRHAPTRDSDWPSRVWVMAAARTPGGSRGRNDVAGQATAAIPARRRDPVRDRERWPWLPLTPPTSTTCGANSRAMSSAAAATSWRSNTPSVDVGLAVAVSVVRDRAEAGVAQRAERRRRVVVLRGAEPVRHDHGDVAPLARRSDRTHRQRDAVDGAHLARDHAVVTFNTWSASSGRHTTKSGSHVLDRLYSSGDPSRRDVCNPVA